MWCFFQEAEEFLRRHRLESEIIHIAAQGLGFTYNEPVSAERSKSLCLGIKPLNYYYYYFFILLSLLLLVYHYCYQL